LGAASSADGAELTVPVRLDAQDKNVKQFFFVREMLMTKEPFGPGWQREVLRHMGLTRQYAGLKENYNR
jgi:hypothetical protein